MFKKIKVFLFDVEEEWGENRWARLLGIAILVALIVFAIYHKEVMGWFHLINS